MAVGLKIWRSKKECGGHNLPSLVEIGLTDLLKFARAKPLPSPGSAIYAKVVVGQIRNDLQPFMNITNIDLPLGLLKTLQNDFSIWEESRL